MTDYIAPRHSAFTVATLLTRQIDNDRTMPHLSNHCFCDHHRRFASRHLGSGDYNIGFLDMLC